jgi:DHA1 family bicyclomycin/chloramphenicol resistance-like MFS transporter
MPSTVAGTILLLGSMTAIGAIAGDIYLPAMPEMARDLAAPNSLVQATVAATLFGGAIGQLLIGPLSDKLGRRRPALAGIALHIIASVAIMFSPNIGILLALRVVQGIGNAGGQVVAASVVRDLYTGSQAARLMSQLMLVIGVAPLFAPSLGAWLTAQFGWHSNFGFLALIGLILEIAMALKLADTLDDANRQTGRLRDSFRSFRVLARDRRFVALGVVPGLGMAVMMTWVSTSSFLLLDHYKVSTWAYPLLFALGGLTSTAGAQVNAHLVRHRSPAIMLRLALPCALVLAIVALGFMLAGWGGLAGLLVPLFAILFLGSMGPPNAMALAMTRHGEIAGAAAALIGTAQTMTSGLVIVLVSWLGGTQLVLTATIVGCLGLATSILALGTPIYRERFGTV